jgi:hypothetical protein
MDLRTTGRVSSPAKWTWMWHFSRRNQTSWEIKANAKPKEPVFTCPPSTGLGLRKPHFCRLNSTHRRRARTAGPGYPQAARPGTPTSARDLPKIASSGRMPIEGRGLSVATPLALAPRPAAPNSATATPSSAPRHAP